MPTAGTDVEAVLAEYGFRIERGTVTRSDLTTALPRIAVNTESRRRSDFSELDTLFQGTTHHGKGQLYFSDPASYEDSNYCDTRIEGQVIPAPARHLTYKTGGTDPDFKGEVVDMVYWVKTAKLYMLVRGYVVADNRLYEWDNANSEWDAVTGADSLLQAANSHPTSMEVFTWSNATNRTATASDYLVISRNRPADGQDANALGYILTTNGTTFTVTAGSPQHTAVVLTTFKERFAYDNTNNGVVLRPDPNSTTGDIIITTVGSALERINNLVVLGELLVALKPSGAWGIFLNTDGTTYSSKPLIDYSYLRDDNNGRAAVVHQGFLYFNVGQSLYQFNGTSVRSVGPDLGASEQDRFTTPDADGVVRLNPGEATFHSTSAKRGKMLGLTASANWIYGTIAALQTPTLQAYAGTGWHELTQLSPSVLANNTFEAGTDGWSAFQSTIAQSAVQAHMGTKSLKVLVSGANTSYSAFATSVSLSGTTTNRVFTGTFWAYGEGDSVGRSLSILVKENGGATGVEESSASITLIAGWQQYTVTRTLLRADRTTIELHAFRPSGATSGEYFYLDDTSLYETTPGTQPVAFCSFQSQLTTTGVLSTPTLWYREGPRLQYLILPEGTDDRYDYTAVDYETTEQRELITSWYDVGLRELWKDLLELYVDLDVPDSSSYVTVSFQVDGFSTWYSLGSTYGLHDPLRFPDTAGNPGFIRARMVRYRFAFSNTSTTAPKLRGWVIRYITRPLPRYGWTMQVLAEDDLPTLDRTMSTAQAEDLSRRLYELRERPGSLRWDDGRALSGKHNYAKNPSMGGWASGVPVQWQLFSTPTVTQDAQYKWEGVYAAKVVATAGGQGIEQTTGARTTLTNGATYHVVARLRVTSGTVKVSLIRVTGGATVASTTLAFVAATNDWDPLGLVAFTRVAFNAVAPAGEAHWVRIESSGGAATFWVDGVELREGADDLSPYIAPDQPRCRSLTNGTFHATVSYRPPFWLVYVSGISEVPVATKRDAAGKVTYDTRFRLELREAF